MLPELEQHSTCVISRLRTSCSVPGIRTSELQYNIQCMQNVASYYSASLILIDHLCCGEHTL